MSTVTLAPHSGQDSDTHLFILDGKSKDDLPNLLLSTLDEAQDDPKHFLYDAESVFLDLHRANNRSEYPIWEHIRDSVNILSRLTAQYKKVMRVQNKQPSSEVREALDDIESAVEMMQNPVSDDTIAHYERGIRRESYNMFVNGETK